MCTDVRPTLEGISEEDKSAVVECFRAYFERCGDGTPDADSMTCGCEGQKPPHFCPDPEDTSQKSWSDYFILPVLKAWDDALYKRVCPNNDKKKVMAILAVDHETASGYTSLMMAAESGHERCSLELLKAGAAVNHAAADGFTALMVAAQNGHEGCALVLLKAGATANHSSKSGRTALMQACQSGHEGCALELLKEGADLEMQTAKGTTALMSAAKNGHERCALALLKAKADPNMADNEGVTALMLAAQDGHEGCALELLKAKAAVDQQDEQGWTALMFACQNGHERCALELLKAKADPNYAKADSWTVMMFACQNGHERCALELLKAGAAVNHATADGFTALMAAAQNGHEGCALELLKAGATVDQTEEDGYTALMFAAQDGHERCALELLKAGALLPAVDVPSTATLIARFGTIGAQASATPPKVFYEIELITLGSCPQIGWASSDFVLGEGAPQDEGVGDDAASWGADGARKLLLHSGSSSSWGIGWCAGDVIGVAADLSAGTTWFGKNGVWEVGFSNVHLEGLFPAVSGSGLICCIRFGDKCLLPPPDEKFVPYPQAPIELLRGEVGTLLNACELPPAVLVRGAYIWLLAKGSGNDSCAKLIAEWAAQ